jgi:hypothetical protein
MYPWQRANEMEWQRAGENKPSKNKLDNLIK